MLPCVLDLGLVHPQLIHLAAEPPHVLLLAASRQGLAQTAVPLVLQASVDQLLQLLRTALPARHRLRHPAEALRGDLAQAAAQTYTHAHQKLIYKRKRAVTPTNRAAVVACVRSQPRQLSVRKETVVEHPVVHQRGYPYRVLHIALASRHLLYQVRIDHHSPHPVLSQNCPNRTDVYARALHRHCVNPFGHDIIAHPLQIRCECGKFPHNGFFSVVYCTKYHIFVHI